MKKYFVLMICALLVWSLIPIPDADAALRPQTGLKYYQSRLGGVQIDSLTWSTNFDSVRVGTLESTSRDTTITVLEISGASSISVTFITRSKSDGQVLTVTPQVSPDLASWTNLQSVWSVSSSAGSAVGQDNDSFRDTALVIFTPSFLDSVLGTTGTGFDSNIKATRYDNAALGASRYIRFVAYQATSTDTVYLKAITTVVWPPNPR